MTNSRKRLAIILLCIILVGSASWGAISAVTNIPHENPATAETRFDIVLPCLLHGDIIGLLAEKNYSQARLLLEQLKIDYAHLPEDIAFILMARYNDLIAQLSSRLDALDNVLSECELLLSQNKLQEARPKLGEAKGLIGEAVELVEDVNRANDELIDLLAPLISPEELDTISQAKARLQESLERIRELEAWYGNKLEGFETITAEKEELLSTEVTLEINPAQVWVGSYTTASGKLMTQEGSPLTARNVLVSFTAEHLTTTTADDGSYEVVLDIPYNYIPGMIVQTSYLPQGEDKNIYLASSSPSREIAILFHPTQLAIEAPQEVYPGLPITISGKVSSEGDFVERNVQGFLDGNHIFDATTVNRGLFTYQTSLSPQIQPGEHKLTVTVPPENKSRLAGCSIDRTLTVMKVTPQIKMDAPKVIILPQAIEATGEVYSEFPMQGATATLEMAGFATTTSIENGRFKARLNLPFKFSVMGFKELELSVKPLEPWHLPAKIKARVFVLNSAILGIILATFAFLGVMVSTRKRRKIREEAKDIPILLGIERPVEGALEPRVRLEGRSGSILETYFAAVRFVEGITKLSMELQMTLREFLNQIRLGIGSAVDAFAELSILAERILYSPYAPDENDVLRAKNLALKIEEASKK